MRGRRQRPHVRWLAHSAQGRRLQDHVHEFPFENAHGARPFCVEPKIRDAVMKLLKERLLNLRQRPRECLLINGAFACADESEAIRREFAERRTLTESDVHQRLLQAVADGELSLTANIKARAKFIATFNNGLAVQRRSANANQELLDSVDLAMKVINAELTHPAASHAQ